jgi:hypothetical protein
MQTIQRIEDDIAAAASGSTRQSRIKAASKAISLIAEELGMQVAVVLLWSAFEECCARMEKDKLDE